jgi:hypothetical protein
MQLCERHTLCNESKKTKNRKLFVSNLLKPYIFDEILYYPLKNEPKIKADVH